ncbi:DUF1330 domain-containing protein [Mycobacterium shigaense]|uniref:Uncharacterized protein n=1 Tax=Mycobacterium shigaense TaxID=722731 RepID=A0A1Z4EER6_9MYCO|nr:DUF1330 domain-containing protein [Mycobacterium shigaense]MEA1122016.1 DUF1330 domain-containing protein [Mycobacterium shigaense]PRI16228.1 hypothetical protein B2J96_05325 [Mycobacterium shigaense]BAX91456.1 hypothetical protein MSG_01298 [Mycobacterium shigaense]
MNSIEPDETQLRTLLTAAADNDEPVVMINLLQFGSNGADCYQRYAQAVQPFLESVGATVLYAGEASHVVAGDLDRPWWDAIVAVRYPSRAAFVTMATSPDYHEHAHVHRAAALENTHLIATDPWQLG